MNALFSQAAPLRADQVKMVEPQIIRDWIAQGEAVVIDVRETEEFEDAHIPGALSMPLSIFQPSKLPDVGDKKLVLHCRSANRCGMAAMKLLTAGYTGEINRMAGGIIRWAQMGGELEG